MKLKLLKLRVKLRANEEGEHEIVSLEPSPEREDWQSFEDIIEGYECASSQETWDANMAWSASPVPGCRWHCDACHEHDITPTTLQRPTHCGVPMELEAVSWMANQFDSAARSLAVAMGLVRE